MNRGRSRTGCPSNSINQLIQSRSGYIWAATFDGLVRFDGVRFTVFNAATSDGLPSNRIMWVREARDGTLWLFTEQHHLVHFHDGGFVHVNRDRGLGDEEIETILEDSTGVVWVTTTKGVGVIRDDRFVPVARETISTYARSLVQRRDGSIWVGTERRGLFRITPEAKATRVAANSAIDGDIVGRMDEDRDGMLWVAANHGLWRWRDRPARVDLPGQDPSQPLLVLNMVRSPTSDALYVQAERALYRVDSTSVAIVDSLGLFLSGTRLWTDGRAVWYASGAAVFREATQTFALAPPEPTTGSIIPPNTITTALVDREGSFWFGTHAAGLHRLKPALFTTYSAKEGIADRNVYPTFIDHSGVVWAGTAGKGLSRIDPKTGHVESFGPPRVKPRINTFFEPQPGELWVGGQGFFADVCVTATMTCRDAGPPGNAFRTVFALHGDASGAIWAGSGGGLFRFDGGRWTHLDSTDGAPRAPVRAFVNTRDGAVWMGTNGGGVVRYHDRRFTAITTADGLPSNLVRSLYQDANGWLWIGTEGRGLARLDPRAWDDSKSAPKASIVRIASKDGLFDDVIHQILEDDAGRLWMSTNRGIFWATRAELDAFADGKINRVHSTGYTERDGMRNREANGGVYPAGAKGKDGRLWFPTQDGVVVVDPRRAGGDRLAPPIVVEQVTANGHTRAPRGDSIVLGVNERDVQIEYTALTFLEPHNVRFRYRLVPYDADWVDVGNRRTAFYTKVPPGRYTFLGNQARRKVDGMSLAARCSKILTNLLSNAIKFTPPGGSIDVVLTHVDDNLTLDVRDTGPGIPADQLAHVFERFYQADESNLRTQPGTGIGLALVKELVDVQHGHIAVQSSEAGTTFSVTLPRGTPNAASPVPIVPLGIDAPAALVTDPHPGIAPESSVADDNADADAARDDVPTLLVVDDSADLRAYIRDHFAPNFRVIEGGDGGEGIMLAQRHLPDVIISDVMMPGTDGHALLRTLRSSPETDFVPVILLTAAADGDQRLAGLEGGADDYIVKPFEMRELEARVRNIIESRRRLRVRLATGAEPNEVASSAPADATATEPDRFSPADRAFMDKVTGIIEHHLSDADFDVTALSREAAVERSRLFRRARDLFGLAPSDLIRSMRVAAGARLLESKSGTVADVAYAVGFNSVAYFRRCFQEAYGLTPAAYRDAPRARPVQGEVQR